MRYELIGFIQKAMFRIGENIVYDIKDVNVRESDNRLLFVIFYNERKSVEE